MLGVLTNSVKTLATPLLVLLTAACSRPAPTPPPPRAADAGPVHRTEVEPNDRPEQSMAVGESTVVSGSLQADSARVDEDWYLLFTDHPRTVDVRVSGIPGTQLLLEVYDVARNRLSVVTGESEGAPARLPNLSVKDKLLLKLSSTRKGTGGAYSLSLLFAESATRFVLDARVSNARGSVVAVVQVKLLLPVAVTVP